METVLDKPLQKKALLMPQEAAERLIPKFKKMARQLRPNDPHLRADLVQEMCMSCLEVPVPMTLTTYCLHALHRAMNFLEREEQIRRTQKDYKVMCRPRRLGAHA